MAIRASDKQESGKNAEMTEAKQGHRYKLGGIEVLAMENGKKPMVHKINHADFWPLSTWGRVDAKYLTPLPMVYFHGETP